MRTLPQKASLQRRPSAASPTDTPAAVFRQGQRGNSVYRHYAHGCDPGRLAAPDGLMDLGAEAAPATAEGGIRPFVFGCARRGAPPSPERTAGVYTPARPLAPQGRTGTERQDAADPVLAHADAGRGPPQVTAWAEPATRPKRAYWQFRTATWPQSAWPSLRERTVRDDTDRCP